MAAPRVSVRAMILALSRYGLPTPAKAKTLERKWATYREQHGLDVYGKTLLETHRGERCCGPSNDTSHEQR